jgi:dTDP-4-amino-4,6-dideoxygalactose transaminase
MIKMVALRRENPSIENFVTARTAIFRKHKFGYLSFCTENFRTAIRENFNELDNIIKLRKSQANQLDDLFSEFKHIEIPRKLGSNVLWRYSFTVNDGDRNRSFDALRSAGCIVTKFFEPCHRKYGMDDKYFPNTVRIWENIINVKFPAGSDFGFRSMKAKIKSATI